MGRLSRISLKCRQIIAFFRSSKTPLALTADAIRMKRRPFVAISRDNIKLSLAPSRGESFTFYENLIRRDYLSGGIRLKPGDTVVDIGANIGSFTVLAASIVGPGGRVIALEPVSGTFARLQKNVGLNRLENVTCRNEAVDSRAGTLEIRVAAKSALSSAFSDVDGTATVPADVESVPTITLEQVRDEEHLDRINLLKVDCEGSEYAIFNELPPHVARRIDQIAMEVHEIPGRSYDQLVNDLRALGFRVDRRPLCWVAFNTATEQWSRRPIIGSRPKAATCADLGSARSD